MNRYARIEVHPLPSVATQELSLGRVAQDLGLPVTSFFAARLFFLAHPALTGDQVERLCASLLSDQAIESYRWRWVTNEEEGVDSSDSVAGEEVVVEVMLLPGVTDRVAQEIREAAQRLGLPMLRVATGQQYRVRGEFRADEVQRLAGQVLCNEVFQRFCIGAITPAFMALDDRVGHVEMFQLADLDDERLLAFRDERRLVLNQAEMQVLRSFCQTAARALTDVELEMIAQAWAGRCGHRTFGAQIRVREFDSQGDQVVASEVIDGLLKTTIQAATVACSKPWVVSALVADVGIVGFDDQYVLAFKVDMFLPSALEPLGGAHAGVGGVLRAVLGVSARPIALTDVLCFGSQRMPMADVPAGVRHPRRVRDDVVAGIGDYGNKVGVPTVNGAVVYHPGYTIRPLVACGCLGVAPVGAHVATTCVGDRLIVVGGRTGRDGLRDAPVQIGDPIVEKDVTELVLAARDAHLYHAIVDCGVGGLALAIGEMVRSLGAEVELLKVGVTQSGLYPWEIWLAETRGRMVLAVPPKFVDSFAALCDRYDVHWSDVGAVTGTGAIVVNYAGQLVVDLPVTLLYDDQPPLQLIAEWHPVVATPTGGDLDSIDLAQAVLTLLADPNVASKEAIIRTYDYEVRGATVIKPLTGYADHGPSDAAVMFPLGSPSGDDDMGAAAWRGVAICNGMNPAYGLLDPYAMAVSAVDEAVRNAVAVGGDPDQLALLNGFCWGNLSLPEQLGGLVRAAKGCYDAARVFDAPFIAGEGCLNDESVARDGQHGVIPGSVLISAIAQVPDVRRAVTMDAKSAGDVLYIVGGTRDELGGSLFARHYQLSGGTPPALPPRALDTARALHRAVCAGLVCACHDVSEGGLAVAAAEMALAGGLGMTIDLAMIPIDMPNGQAHAALLLFSESNGRWLVEVAPQQVSAFEQVMDGLTVARCGVVTQEAILRIGSIALDVSTLEHVWRDER